MDYRLPLTEIKTPEDVQKLVSSISEAFNQLDVLTTTTAPNGNISGREGQLALYNNSGSYELWICVDGGTTWQQIGAESFVQGDWIISSVNTARTGWTNVSATYSNKFMRINATPLSTGGADTHSHTIAEANLPAHTHAAGTLAAASATHNHTIRILGSSGGNSLQGHKPPADLWMSVDIDDNAGTSYDLYPQNQGAHTHTVSGSTGSIGSGTAFTADNVPAYVQVCVFQKD
jgi:hypothetical protein